MAANIVGGWVDGSENPPKVYRRNIGMVPRCTSILVYLLMATGDGGSAPGMAVPAPLLGGGPRCSWPPLHGAEFLGVVELETGADVGTLTGLVGVGGGGGATGTAGLIKGWLKKVSKSIRSLASLFSRPKRRLANSGEVPFGILKKIKK